MSDVREEVRERYASIARNTESCCNEASCGDGSFGSALYNSLQTDELPDAARLMSLGCGNPTAVADLKEGETVLDLGSGGGIDVFLSAKRVGNTGKVYGLDMTDEMLAIALKNKAEAGATNVEFLKGYIETIPLPADTLDVVISNCVINLSVDKQAVFNEIFRTLKPGGRIGISDVVASNELSAEDRAKRGTYVGCIAGALSFDEYEAGLKLAGFENIELTPTHDVNEGMFSAIVKARKPIGVMQREELPMATSKGCC
ncbi:MAG: arsenite methyltransferase [Actinomycetota bacterium]|nr:arsenite methyltransferase [Actinomycetota bacterium]